MFNDFTLLQGMSMFKRVVVGEAGTVVDGVFYHGQSVTNYVEFTSDWEPYRKSQENDLLPAGLKSSDVIVIYTEDLSLVLHNDLKGSATKASVVYVEDPKVNLNATPFVCFDRASWDCDRGFQLLTSPYREIICVREEKL
ncbi:head-closure protein [Vibrio phage 1.101.O._10N.261.45.C6]|nr:head-closure protein [Vibrio phage 1.101.O._10N.261.45.C6]